ncbi:hypothetical protein [Nocardia gipuzkoensis]|uniref:hypothetical protein n=1 Tax=Nocardia gipuzkoensis TaxID=2749991 RepID=UPI00237D8D1F|nr:hypothetical protein [Nocardia gipuzkoensis]MDE1675272.1 hypothetical protein [Nocardia gipuzkoensis]
MSYGDPDTGRARTGHVGRLASAGGRAAVTYGRLSVLNRCFALIGMTDRSLLTGIGIA